MEAEALARIGCSVPTTCSKHLNAILEGLVDIGLHGAFQVKVNDPHFGILLTDAVDAANTLLHPHGVPGHVVVNQGTAELEVESFGGGIGAEKDPGSPMAEAFFRVFPGEALPHSSPAKKLAFTVSVYWEKIITWR